MKQFPSLHVACRAKWQSTTMKLQEVVSPILPEKFLLFVLEIQISYLYEPILS